MLPSMASAEESANDGAPRRGTPAATYPSVTAACDPVTSDRGAGRFPGRGVVWLRGALCVSCTSPLLPLAPLHHFLPRASAVVEGFSEGSATDWRSCRSHARSRRCRRLAAAPVAPSTSMEVNN